MIQRMAMAYSALATTDHMCMDASEDHILHKHFVTCIVVLRRKERYVLYSTTRSRSVDMPNVTYYIRREMNVPGGTRFKTLAHEA